MSMQEAPTMQMDIPRGLRTTYLVQFIFTLIFGLAGTFAAGFVGDLAGHPVHDVDVNLLLETRNPHPLAGV